MRKRDVAVELSKLSGFREPRVELEQYPTPPDVAAQLLHVAAMYGDLAGRLVVDLGAGTGPLALGAAYHDPAQVIGIDCDRSALEIATENAARIDPPAPVAWVQGDVREPPVADDVRESSAADDVRESSVADDVRESSVADDVRESSVPDPAGVTVVANPPFGAQTGQRGADEPFLRLAARLGAVSYTFHNGGSRSFLEAVADDWGGRITDAFGVEFALDRQFAHQTSERTTIDAEAYRIVWDGAFEDGTDPSS